MVCMVSSTGRTTDSTALLWDATIPIRTPSTTDMATEIPIRLSVSMAGSHMSMKPQNIVATTQNSPRRRPPTLRAGRAMARTTTGQGSRIKKVSTVSKV